jgi:type VI secretion system Hcp family effector
MRGHHTLLTIDKIDGFSKYSDKAIDVVTFEYSIGHGEGTPGASHSSARLSFDGVKVKKVVDKASPLIFQALTQSTTIATVGLFLYRDVKEGGKDAELWMTLTLEKVKVTSQKLVDPPEGEAGGGVPYEEVVFMPLSFEISHNIAKKVSNFTWSSGIA